MVDFSQLEDKSDLDHDSEAHLNHKNFVTITSIIMILLDKGVITAKELLEYKEKAKEVCEHLRDKHES